MKAIFIGLVTCLVSVGGASVAGAGATTLKVDPAKSQLHWTGSKVIGSSHDGAVRISSGKINVEDNIIRGGDFVIDMKSIEALDLRDNAKDKLKLEAHLKSDDFFGVASFPKATFKITKVVSPSSSKGFTHDIVGELTIKGKTDSVVIPSRVTLGADEARAEGSVEVDRTKFDVKFGSKRFFENLVGNRVINDKFKIDMKLVARK